jgi:hypothetical protein
VQLQKNPSDHGVEPKGLNAIDNHLLQICRRALENLSKIGALEQAQGQVIIALPASHIMSQSLVEYQAMTAIVNIPFDADVQTVLRAICDMEGLQRPVRRNEKKALNEAQ